MHLFLSQLRSHVRFKCRSYMQAHLDIKQSTHPELGADIGRLKLEVETNIPDLLHVKITDAANKRWEVPEKLLAKTAEQMKSKFAACCNAPCLQRV